MKGFWILFALAGFVMAACQPAASTPQELPTLAVLPSAMPPTVVEVTEVTSVPAVPTATHTPAPTITLMPTSVQPSPTLESAAVSTAASPQPPTEIPPTIVIRQEVVRATLTPVPPGANAPLRTTPMDMADVVITERDFQRAVDLAVADIDSIEIANIDFVPGGIDVQLTALGGTAYITGNVHVSIEVTGDFAAISIDDITVNAAEPPEGYIETVNGDFFSMIVKALDDLLTERVGEGHDLENIVLNDEAMEVFLLVPQQ